MLRPRRALVFLAFAALQASSAFASSPAHHGPRPTLSTASPKAAAASSEDSASLLERATFSWLNPTLKLGSERPLEEGDLPRLVDRDSARHSADVLEREWQALAAVGAAQQPQAVGLAMWRSFGQEFKTAGLVKLASDACQLAAPLLLKRIVHQLEAGVGVREGLGVTIALLAASCLQAFALRHYFALVFRTGLRLRAAMVGVCYRKLLRLSPAARLELSTGEVTNLVSVDANRLSDLVPYLHALWFAPLQIVAALALLFNEVGVALLPGVALIALMLATNKRIAQRTFRKQAELLGIRDRRMRLVREVVSNIKIVKLHAWELLFERRLQKVAEVTAVTASNGN